MTAEHTQEMWEEITGAYFASKTQRMVDVYLRGISTLVGVSRGEQIDEGPKGADR